MYLSCWQRGVLCLVCFAMGYMELQRLCFVLSLVHAAVGSMPVTVVHANTLSGGDLRCWAAEHHGPEWGGEADTRQLTTPSIMPCLDTFRRWQPETTARSGSWVPYLVVVVLPSSSHSTSISASSSSPEEGSPAREPWHLCNNLPPVRVTAGLTALTWRRAYGSLRRKRRDDWRTGHAQQKPALVPGIAGRAACLATAALGLVFRAASRQRCHVRC